MTITRLRPTFTFDQDRLDALRAIAPEAFADGKINREALLEALGEHLEDEASDGGVPAEHFGLFWPGKRQARQLASTPSAGTLRPAPGEGVNEATTRHLFIEGDNLEVLKLLQKSYAGRVKMIEGLRKLGESCLTDFARGLSGCRQTSDLVACARSDLMKWAWIDIYIGVLA